MKKIGIAGVGGIGSNIAVHLVRAGVKKLKYADFDVVDRTNLNRQFYFCDQIGFPKTVALEINLKRINPELSVEYNHTRITKENIKEIFDECDIIVEGFDNVESKKLLLETFWDSEKVIVSANGIAGTDTSGIRVVAKKNIYMTGDFETDIAEHKTYSHKVSAVAAVMAGIVYDKYNERKE